MALARAVQTIVQEAVRLGRLSGGDLMIDAEARHLHVVGFASAEEVGQPAFRDVLRAYLKSLKGGGPGDGIEVRPGDGARIAVRFASALPRPSRRPRTPGRPHPCRRTRWPT